MTDKDMLVCFGGIDPKYILMASPSDEILNGKSSSAKSDGFGKSLWLRLGALAAAIIMIVCAVPILLNRIPADSFIEGNYTEVLEQCDLAVFGTYKGKNENLNYSEYVFEVTEVFKGDVNHGEITVRSDKSFAFSDDEMEKHTESAGVAFEQDEEYFLTLKNEESEVIRFVSDQIIDVNDLGGALSGAEYLREFLERNGVTVDTSRKELKALLDYIFEGILPEEEREATEDILYQLASDEKSYKVTGYKGMDEYIIIPAEYEGLPVTEIGSNAFMNNPYIKSVRIPDSVQWIGDRAFESCAGLVSVNLPEKTRFPGFYVFADCRRLVSVDIQGDVWSLSTAIFQGCRSLKYINLPDSLVEIGHSAFEGCVSLEEIHIPESTMRIYDSSFMGCESLARITVDENNKHFHEEGNCLIETNTQSLILGCATSNIPDDESVTSIADRAFYRMDITEIVIPGNIKSIGIEAFGSCAELKTVKMLEGVEIIGEKAFFGCSSLEKIEIPDSIKRVDAYAIENMTDISRYNVYDNMCYLGNEGNPYALLVKVFDAEQRANVELPSSVKVIGDYAFYNAENLNSLILPSGVAGIGEKAFSGCLRLENLVIPSSIEWIGSNAFANCNSLNYNLHSNAKYLGNEENPYLVLVKADRTGMNEAEVSGRTKLIYDRAFENCSFMSKIFIPSSVKRIGHKAFDNCTALVQVEIESIEDWLKTDLSSFGSNPLVPMILTDIKGQKLCINGKVITSFKVADGVMRIEDNAFANFPTIEELVIPDSVTVIERSAFSGCSLLKRIVYGGTKEQWMALEADSYWSFSISLLYTVTCSDGVIEH